MCSGDSDVDVRLAGVETNYFFPPKDIKMRIPDQLIKCVGFVSRNEDPLQFGGTAFVVGVRVGSNKVGYLHLVTAKHVAEAIEPGEFVIAMNGKDGSPLFLKSGEVHWWYHPTEPDSVDVAVIPFASERLREYDIEWIPEDVFATDKRIADFGIGLGDEIVIVGLFTRFCGSSHLIPLVRTGNIAMMPKDKLPLSQFGDIDAYLAEGRSIGGLSGSPVFVRSTVHMPVQSKAGELSHISGLGPLHFLGLIHGHWDLPNTFSAVEQAEAVNMGVSIIIPAKKVLEVLYHPELVQMRKEMYERGK